MRALARRFGRNVHRTLRRGNCSPDWSTLRRLTYARAGPSVYHALADPSRRAIVWRLAAEGELKVTDLAHPFEISLNAVSKHIKVLQGAGLIQRRVAGRDHWLSLRSEPLAAALR